MPTFQVKARLYENFIAVQKYNFLDSFSICFGCVQNLCCNDSKYQVSVMNADISDKSSSVSGYIVYRVSFIFRLNALLVSVCTKGFA